MTMVIKLEEVRLISHRSFRYQERTRHVIAIPGKMKRKVNTRKTLGRVWFHYFQLYGMTDKLAATCARVGWTKIDKDTYAKEHYHLVNQFTTNMTKDDPPDVPHLDDFKW